MIRPLPGWLTRSLRAAPFAVTAAVCNPVVSSGQLLSGRVLEEGAQRPVVGALVSLVSSSGSDGLYVLTDEGGRYRLRAPGGGLYTLVIERIGYHSFRRDAIEVPAQGARVLDFTVSPSPVTLEGIQVSGASRRCESVPSAASATQTLWDEARKALLAALTTERERTLRFRIVSREASLDPRSLARREVTRRVRTEWGANSVRSLPSTELALDGYVRDSKDGGLDLYAPDASALLSSEFLDTHCLSPRAAPDSRPGEIGVDFRPIPGRSTRDIEGVLWLDAGSFRLDRVEFTYTNMPGWPGVEHAGGVIRFAELPDGRWIVRDWSIRAPVVRGVRTDGPRGTTQRLMLQEIVERGSAVIGVDGAGVRWVADRPGGSVEGVVHDSLTGGTLPGADVRLAGRSWRARADGEGRFRIPDVPPGAYRIEFSHPRLDSLNVMTAPQEVQVRAGEVTEVALAVPSWKTVLAEGCGIGEAHLVGFVRAEGTLEPIPGASVVLRSEESAEAGANTVTDARGAFRLCGVEADAAMTIVARLGPLVSAVRPIAAGFDGPLRVDLALPLGRVSLGATDASPGQHLLVGTVIDLQSNQPLSDVLVELTDTLGRRIGHALSDPHGRFVLLREEHVVALRASRFGYAELEAAIDTLRDGKLLEVRLAPQALSLEGIIVTVEARVRHLEQSGFYQRQFLSGGQFLDRAQIQAMRAMRTTDVLLRLPGVWLFSGESSNTTARRIQLRGAMRFTNDQRCLPGVYVDGLLVRYPIIPAPPSAKGDPFRQLANYPQIDDLIDPHDIEAVEVYDTPAVTPPQFRAPGPSCGVLVIWTQRGLGG